MKLSEDQFWNEYEPIVNHLDDNASFGGCMFETFGPEYDHVTEQLKKNPKKVWTIFDTDAGLIITAGWHYVNRFGYLITEKEWVDEDDYVENDDDEDEEEVFY